jgi:ribosome-binding factor A
MNRRIARLNDMFREEISDLLRRQIRDPRLEVFITITRVEVSADFSYARVFVSVMGTDEEKAMALRGLESASSFLRRELGNRLKMRRAPALSFRQDDSLERGAEMLDLLQHVEEEEEPS